MTKTKYRTEDEIRDESKLILGFDKKYKDVECGTGQITTFNQLGFKGSKDKPDGWYLPKNKNDTAIILETKSEEQDITKYIDEIKKNCDIVLTQYKDVIGILWNGIDIDIYHNNNQIIGLSKTLENCEYYLKIITNKKIDKEKIYTLTAKINNNLHFNFGVKNLYHRMIFTACALVAVRYGANLTTGMDFSLLHQAILSQLHKSLTPHLKKNLKLNLLSDVYTDIKMNNSENQDAIDEFIENVIEISDQINSDNWRGEDVMGIFFNEFNRYKKKTENGQVFTPEHITSLMYRLIDCDMHDCILDAACGSGGFLTKAMSKMIQESGGIGTKKAEKIVSEQLYGIEFDREIFALACANMLIHKDGKTNFEQLDTRSKEAGDWIKSKPITKVLMNPPFEKKYGCMDIVNNVLKNVNKDTLCAFILPDKKLEKESKAKVKALLKNNRIETIVKLPEKTFSEGVTTSIFIIRAGVPQNNNNIVGYYIEEDGLETVKNKGRQDVKDRWNKIEEYWVKSIHDGTDTEFKTRQIINPKEHLSYQMPEKPFEISEEDFKKTAMDYICFKNGIDIKVFGEKLLNSTLYGSEVTSDNTGINIKIGGGSND